MINQRIIISITLKQYRISLERLHSRNFEAFDRMGKEISKEESTLKKISMKKTSTKTTRKKSYKKSTKSSSEVDPSDQSTTEPISKTYTKSKSNISTPTTIANKSLNDLSITTVPVLASDRSPSLTQKIQEINPTTSKSTTSIQPINKNTKTNETTNLKSSSSINEEKLNEEKPTTNGKTNEPDIISNKQERKSTKKSKEISITPFSTSKQVLHPFFDRILMFRKFLFQILSLQTPKHIASQLINGFLVVTITISIISIIINTVSGLSQSIRNFFTFVDIFSCVIFGLEFLIRLWCEIERNPTQGPFHSRLIYLRTRIAFCDLFGFLGFMLYLFFSNTIFVAFLQLLRLLVLVKIIRYTPSFNLIISVIQSRRSELVSTMIAMFIGLFFASVMVFYAERFVQPEKFPNLFTTMYWAGITMGTVGYGDIIPISPMGKALSIIVILMGIALFTLPASLIGSGFMEEFQRLNPRIDNCPNCCKEIKETEILTDLAAFKPKRRKSSKKKMPIEKNDIVTPVSKVSEQFTEESTTTYQRIQSRTYEYLDGRNSQERGPRIISKFILFLIWLNILAIMVETDPDFYPFFEPYLPYFAEFTLVVFSIEYLLRLWTCVVDERYSHPLKGRVKYILTPMAIINLLAIIPYFITSVELNFLRMFRILLVFKVSHFSDALETVGTVLKAHYKELLMAGFLAFIILIYASTIMFYAEKDAQPDKFTSIPASIWWGLVTLATVGYGDLYPVTTIGRFFATFTAFIGVGLFSLPTGIIGAGFYDYIKNRRKPRICPYCGFVLKKEKPGSN